MSQPAAIQETSDTSKYKPKNIPIDLILYYIETKGLNQTETAQLLGCDSSNISRRLQEIDYIPGHLKSFKEGRADILAFHQSEILKQLTTEKLKKAQARDLTTMFGIFYDKERLERGESTENIAYHDIAKSYNQARDRRIQLEKDLGVNTQDNV